MKNGAATPAPAAKAATPAPAAKKARPSGAKKTAAIRNAKPLPVSLPRIAAYSVSADFDAAGRQVLETCVTCGTIAAKGVEDLGKEVAGFTRASNEAQMELTKALLEAKTLGDALQAQSKFAQASFDNLAANWATLTGLSMDLSQDLIEPVQSQVNEAARTIWQPLAA